MIAHQTNGKPRLLDQYGRPFETTRLNDDDRPDGSAQIGGIALPHGFTFIARAGGAYNTYWHERYDEALRHSREDANVMLRDAYLMSLLQERQLAVASLNWHLEIPDPRDKYQTKIKDRITRLIRGIPLLDRIIGWKLEAIWFGRYGVQVQWDWTTVCDRGPDGRPDGEKKRGLTITQAWPINGDKIGFQYDHTPYILVASETEGKLPDADIISTTQGRAVALRGTWRDRFLLHRHLMEDADYFDPDQAGAVHGVGIRSKLFWLNWLKLEWLSSITDFFDRVGLGFTLWKYPAHNAQAKAEALEAARSQSSRAHLVVPTWGESGKDALTGVERVEVPTAGSEALVRLIDYIDKQLERYVVGQAGSARSSPSGIGNEAASEFQMDTKLRITLRDAKYLATSLSGTTNETGLVNFIQKHSAPEADFPIRWVFDVENPQSDSKLNSVRTLVEFGLPIKADEVRAAAGYSKPSEGDELVKLPEQQQGGMPGMPGMPGAAPTGAEGAVAGPDGELPEAGAVEGGAADGAEDGGGDFLESLRLHRAGHPEQYANKAYNWMDMGVVKVSQTGLPLHRWYDPRTKQSRVQSVPPGYGKRKKFGRPEPTTPLLSPVRLGVLPSVKANLESALQLMFDGWVEADALPSLFGAQNGPDPFVADVSRGDDRSLDILAGDGDATWKLSLTPEGALVVTGSQITPDRLERAVRAMLVAGIDSVSTETEEFDLIEVPDDLAPEKEVVAGNERRRERRLAGIDEILALADQLFPAHGHVAETPKRSYSTTRFDLESADPLTTKRILTLAREIDPDDLDDKGREPEPHITVLHGLHTRDARNVDQIVSSFGPVKVRIGGISVFEVRSPDEEFDVVKLDVSGPDLRRLRKAISQLEFTDEHETYRPHITLAYVQAGEGGKYSGPSGLEGTELVFDELVFSTASREKTVIRIDEGKTDKDPLRFQRVSRAVRYLRDQNRHEAAAQLIRHAEQFGYSE